MKGDFKGKNYILRGCCPLEKRFIGNAKIFTADEKNQILRSGKGIEPGMITRRVYHDNRHLDDISRMQEIDLNFWLPGDILLKADKMSMAHSLESRVPYLDREVYEAASSYSPLVTASRNAWAKRVLNAIRSATFIIFRQYAKAKRASIEISRTICCVSSNGKFRNETSPFLEMEMQRKAVIM